MLTILDKTHIGKRIKYIFIKDQFFCASRQREIVKKNRNKFTADISTELGSYLDGAFDVTSSRVRVELPSIAIPATRDLRGTLLMVGILKFSTPDVQMCFYPFHIDGATKTNTSIAGEYLWHCKNDKTTTASKILQCEGLTCPGLAKMLPELREIFYTLCDDAETFTFTHEESDPDEKD